MKTLNLVILFLNLSMITFSQNFQTVRNDKECYYKGSLEHDIHSIRIDSTNSIGNDFVFFNFHEIYPSQDPYMCHKLNEPSWIGEKIIIKQNGQNIFFNYLNDSIIINTQTPINESWLVYKDSVGFYLMGQIIYKDTMSFLSINDTILKILLHVYDSSNQPVNKA